MLRNVSISSIALVNSLSFPSLLFLVLCCCGLVSRGHPLWQVYYLLSLPKLVSSFADFEAERGSIKTSSRDPICSF